MMSRKVFLPGCSLSSYSPENIEQVIRLLQDTYPDLSIVQKCCGRPTKVIGQEELFEQRFESLVADIKACDVDEAIAACQSCLNTVNLCEDYKTTSLWEILPRLDWPEELKGKAIGSDVVFSVHDSCSVRHHHEIHNGIREILDMLGYKYVDPSYTHEKTRCCGYGGGVVSVNPELADRVVKRRIADFETDHIVVYCAACRQSMLKGEGRAWHILDLVFGEVVYADTVPPEDVLSNAVKAWGNRRKSRQAIKEVMEL